MCFFSTVFSSRVGPKKTRIHQILREVGSLAFPGIYDTLSAKIAEQIGFPMGFISGYSLAASTIGEPDFGLLTQTEVVERARAICACVSIPIIVDADTGYGNPLNVYRTVEQLIDAGAAGCFLEGSPKDFFKTAPPPDGGGVLLNRSPLPLEGGSI